MVGVDLSVNMVNIALERRVTVAKQQPLEKRQLCDVAFQVADIMSSEFADGSFDVIYSRDSLLHIQDKPALFERLLRRVRAGLGVATVFANAVFASITGISIASASVFSCSSTLSLMDGSGVGAIRSHTTMVRSPVF